MYGGNQSTLVQAGRDIVLSITKSPPDVRLVRLTVDEDESQGGLRQKLNVIVKNNGDTTAFMLRGALVVLAKEEVADCAKPDARRSVSIADWRYDVDIDAPDPGFDGQHAIAPNEVANFDVMVGRADGGCEWTIYKVLLRLEFDEGSPLETAPFHLDISGPEVLMGCFVPEPPTLEQWGLCMADNIRRLDVIGYDLRPSVDPDSVQHVEAVAPDLFQQSDGALSRNAELWRPWRAGTRPRTPASS